MDIEQMIKLMEAVSGNGITEFSYREGETSVKIKKEDKRGPKVQVLLDGPKPPHPGMQPPPPPCGPEGRPVYDPGMQPPAEPGFTGGAEQGTGSAFYAAAQETAAETAKTQSPAGNRVTCPLVGTFYSAASPEDEPFVQVGDTVKKGQVLCIVEAMKLMNEIESEYDGVVKAILAKNGDLVEYGQELFVIE